MDRQPYLHIVAAVLFAAVCAYVGAALYPGLSLGQTVSPAPDTELICLRLEGICLRDELALSLPEADPLFARDGERLDGETALAAMLGAGEYPGGGPGGGSAVFLAFSDGLEALSVADVQPLSVERVEKLMEMQPDSQGAGARMVRGFDWYYAALSDYDGPLPAGKYRLHFEGFDEGLWARLVETSPPQTGERALLFRLLTGDAAYLRLRNCSAQLILPG